MTSLQYNRPAIWQLEKKLHDLLTLRDRREEELRKVQRLVYTLRQEIMGRREEVNW